MEQQTEDVKPYLRGAINNIKIVDRKVNELKPSCHMPFFHRHCDFKELTMVVVSKASSSKT